MSNEILKYELKEKLPVTVSDEQIEVEKQAALNEFEKDIVKFQKKLDPYQNPKLFKRFGYPGKDFTVKLRSNKYLKCHQSEDGKFYLIARDGSRRKATPKMIEEITQQLNRMTANSIPNLRTIDHDLDKIMIPATTVMQSEEERG